MANYKNILNNNIFNEFNKLYKLVCKAKPFLSIEDKRSITFTYMMENRNLPMNTQDMVVTFNNPKTIEYQYMMELLALEAEIKFGICRYYLENDSLLDFFKNTEVKQKEIQSILDTLNDSESRTFWGVLGKEFSIVICYTKTLYKKHIITILTENMNYTFCIEECNDTNHREWYNLALNFIFYINAFPECVIDGVPNGIKKNPKAKILSTSEKIISHTTVEHGFVRPHFRSGFFRHYNSDFYVNCELHTTLKGGGFLFSLH